MLAQGYPAPQAPAPLPEGLVQGLRDWDATVHKIRALEGQRVEQAYAAADQALKRATGAMKEKEKQVASATQKVESSEKAAEKADDPNFFKKIINTIRKDKAEEEARLAHEQLEKDTKFLELRGLSLVDRQAEYQRATKLVSELKVKVNELNSLRQKEESIVNAIFAPSYCPLVDAHEAGLRTAVAAVTPKLQAMDGYKKTYVGALNHLLKGGDILMQAAETLQRALALNGIGMMGNVMRPGMGQGMGGFMMDVMEQQRLAEGVELAKAACKKIKKAKEMCPDVPRVDLKKLEHLEMGLAMFNMLFGSVLIDLVVRQKINAAYESVLQMLDDVKFGAKWMETTLNTRFKSDYEALVSEQSNAQAALQNYRRTLIFNALSSLAHPHPAPGVPAPAPAPAPAAAPAYVAAPAAPAPWTMWDPSVHDDDD